MPHVHNQLRHLISATCANVSNSSSCKSLLRASCSCIVLVTVAFPSIFITNQPTKKTLTKTNDGQTLLPLHFHGHDSDITSSIPSSNHKTRTHPTILHHS
uniref:Uncharacterized protein n=1 Tax=Brassica campestris TaxID=3711 RepID=A0A3P6AE77_BRACM|nr:unnamed protein product [Brassica rapa]